MNTTLLLRTALSAIIAVCYVCMCCQLAGKSANIAAVSSSFDCIDSGTRPPHTLEHDLDILATFVELAKPGAEVNIAQVVKNDEAETLTPNATLKSNARTPLRLTLSAVKRTPVRLTLSEPARSRV